MRRLALTVALAMVAIVGTGGTANAASCSTGTLSVPHSVVCHNASNNWTGWQYTYGRTTYFPGWNHYAMAYSCWYNIAWTDAQLKQRCDVTTYYRHPNSSSTLWLKTQMNIRTGAAPPNLANCVSNYMYYLPYPTSAFSPNRGYVCPVNNQYNVTRVSGDYDETGSW
jgi:hypothetical protein